MYWLQLRHLTSQTTCSKRGMQIPSFYVLLFYQLRQAALNTPCPPVCLSVRPSVCLHACLSACLSNFSGHYVIEISCMEKSPSKCKKNVFLSSPSVKFEGCPGQCLLTHLANLIIQENTGTWTVSLCESFTNSQPLGALCSSHKRHQRNCNVPVLR